MRRNHWGYTFMLSLLGLSILLAGCTVSGKGTGSSQEITVWSFTDEANYAIDKFEKKYPGVKVNFVNIPGNFYITKLKSASADGFQGTGRVHARKRKYP
ncbi:ABC-type glycerol-3-phosphate transport system substrate-binding protein [Paenibacillus favisporus]|uniref:ABC-type glycerol-3-phosphate transport system substrate-binding protein n=1 Tax=Paenibacillus favisporus TaxID=221028 RepID=A0ABV2EXC7_9BACL